MRKKHKQDFNKIEFLYYLSNKIKGKPFMHIELIKEILTWETIRKSPYSDSFYNSKEISWDYKPDKSLRVADHWNFYAKEKLHCKTDTAVSNDTHFSLGIYNEEKGLYEIQSSWEKIDYNSFQKTMITLDIKALR